MKTSHQHFDLIVSPEAEHELNESFNFYEEKLPGLGGDLVLEVDEMFNRIASNPEQFQKVRKKQVRKAFLKRFPFGVYYVINKNIINVLAIFHHSRNPKQLKKRF